MADKRFWITLLAFACLGIYLFATAPPPLPETLATDAVIPVEEMFAVLEAENDAVRALWTKEIVAEGKKAGLKFDEHWRDPDLEAGPLPALFLRETAKSLEKNPLRLSLFLGSDFPINKANRFEGLQLEKFHILGQTQQPQSFYMADTGLYTGMFSDAAVADACVECHNKHEQTPKRDWRLHDVMGATTWMYPAATVSMSDLVKAVAALHRGFQEAYGAYIKKVQGFAVPPALGERWPSEGYFLPGPEVFMRKVLERTAPHTVAALAGLSGQAQSGEAPRGAAQ
jgi:adenylate cyclase